MTFSEKYFWKMLSFVKVASFSLTYMKMPAFFKHEWMICLESKMKHGKFHPKHVKLSEIPMSSVCVRKNYTRQS